MKPCGTVVPNIRARVYTDDGWFIGECFDAPNPIKALLRSVGADKGYAITKYPMFAEERKDYTVSA